MEYGLQVLALGQRQKIGLSEQEFGLIRRSKQNLELLFKLVEDYRVVVESYRAVEVAKHESALSHLLCSNAGYDDASDTRVMLSSRIAGYLACSRYFIDSTDKVLPKLVSETQAEQFKAFRSAIYDSTKEYRFIEALRNYSQHREIPIDNIKFFSGREKAQDSETVEIMHALSIGVSKAVLASDVKFKKTALEGMPESINLIYCIRSHMEGLWKTHDYLNKTLESVSDESRAVVKNAIDRFEAETKEDSLGLYALAQESDTDIREKVPMLLDWDDARRQALKKMQALKNLSRCYITGKTQPLK